METSKGDFVAMSKTKFLKGLTAIITCFSWWYLLANTNSLYSNSHVKHDSKIEFVGCYGFDDTLDGMETDSLNPWNPIDSIQIALRKRPFITGALDGRNSFVSSDPVNIFGLRYGYDWGKVAAHTGIYSSRYVEFRENDSMLYRFRYISSTFEYKLYRTYRYSFLIFAQLGVGATSIKAKSNPIESADLKPMIPAELGMYGSVRLLRYFGLAAGLGTRLAVLKGGERFSGPIYTFGITYFPSAMLEDSKKEIDKLNIPRSAP